MTSPGCVPAGALLAVSATGVRPTLYRYVVLIDRARDLVGVAVPRSADAVAAVSARFPGLPLVGYEHGDSLAAARRAGFSPIGPLRVWLRD